MSNQWELVPSLTKPLEEGSKLSDDLLVTLKQKLADQGDLEAQKWLNQSLYDETFGQDRNPIHRFNQLREQAINGDNDAESGLFKQSFLEI